MSPRETEIHAHASAFRTSVHPLDPLSHPHTINFILQSPILYLSKSTSRNPGNFQSTKRRNTQTKLWGLIRSKKAEGEGFTFSPKFHQETSLKRQMTFQSKVSFTQHGFGKQLSCSSLPFEVSFNESHSDRAAGSTSYHVRSSTAASDFPTHSSATLREMLLCHRGQLLHLGDYSLTTGP